MAAIDVIELYTDFGPSVGLPLPNDPGAGDAVQFDNLGRTSFKLHAKALSGQDTLSLTVTVEDSTDGDNWSEIASNEFTDTGSYFVTVDTPNAYLRASWTVDDGDWHVPSAVAFPEPAPVA